MLRSPLANPMTTPMINPIRTGISEITRAIMNFNGTQWAESAQTHSVLPGDDFEAEVVVYKPDAGTVARMKAWLSIAEDTALNKAFHFGRIAGDEVRASFFGDDLDVNLSGIVDWSKINRFRFVYTVATRTQTIFLNGVEVGSGVRSADVVINNSKILINKFRDSITSAAYFNVRVAINGVDAINLKLDQSTTIYQRNYASPIADENDPDWSGAILQNALPGDWESIARKPSDDGWRGIEDLFPQTLWQNPPIVGSQWTYEPAMNSWYYDGDGTVNALQLISGGSQIFPVLIEGTVERLAGSGAFGFTASSVNNRDYEVTDAEFTASPVVSYKTVIFNDGGDYQFKRRAGVLSTRLYKASCYRYFGYAEGAL